MTRRTLTALAVIAVAASIWTWLPPEFSIAPESPGAPTGTGSRTVERIYFGPANSLAVMPPASPGAGEPAWLAEGLALDLVNRLAAERRLQLLSVNSSFFFESEDLEPRVIAERLQARHLL
jgi:TolB-like protein